MILKKLFKVKLRVININILAIESSCDETAAAVVKDGRYELSSIIFSQVEEHKKYGGVVPEIASRHHCEVISGITRDALCKADLTLKKIDAIAVTCSPGLIGALLVGVNFAKGLSLGSGIPLIPVDHLRSHIAANYLTHKDLKPPFLCLVVSGGHTHIIECIDYTKFKIIGRTRDDAAGEAFDKAARSMGLPYPGGIHLDSLALKGDINAFKLPFPKVSGNPLDFSFSGLKTAVINIIHNAKQKNEEINYSDLSASFNYTVAKILCDRLNLAAKETGNKKIVLAGGVSANSMLREAMKTMAIENGYELFLPQLKYCGDNAAMVGAQGYYEYLAGNIAGLDLNAKASMTN